MATLETRPGKRGIRFRLVFWLDGKRYSHTLESKTKAQAEVMRASAERKLELIRSGDVKLPEGVDVGTYVATLGQVERKRGTAAIAPLTLGGLFEEYEKALPVGAIEANTLLTTRVHLGHFARLLGEMRPLSEVSYDLLQGYLRQRQKEDNRRGGTISPTTLRKEIRSLSSVWNWALRSGRVTGPFPGQKLSYPSSVERPRFQTWDEIERQIAGGGSEDLWANLFLRREEIDQLLEHVKQHAFKPYIYPMLAMAAHTGARRSELMRSRVEDIDLKQRIVIFRERKRQRNEHTTRSVPLSTFLAKTMAAWLEQHPGGETFYIEKNGGVHPIDTEDVRAHLHGSLAHSKWEKIRGWHVLRHSFASNCAARGIDQRVIDSWLGHQTEEMRKRYRHHFPDQQQAALALVFD